MWRLGPAFDDEDALARAWRAATPFSHLVFDGFAPSEARADIDALLEEEPIETYAGDIFAFEASAPEPRTELLRRVRDGFASTLAGPLSRITAKAVGRADMRAYAYRAGHYLLPHSDHQQAAGRVLAYAWYLPTPVPPEGGELELFTCRLESDEIVETTTARLIEARPDRLVVFEVGDVSLHQVREVLAGLRISLAGWFYP
jgi:Rps23 Pro-64 3,4-dihydroxylase Tpa1-like proline 4-hydroxylase